MDWDVIRAIVIITVWWVMIFATTEAAKKLPQKDKQDDELHSVFEGFQLANISPFIATMGLLILWLGLNYYTVLKTRLDEGG